MQEGLPLSRHLFAQHRLQTMIRLEKQAFSASQMLATLELAALWPSLRGDGTRKSHPHVFLEPSQPLHRRFAALRAFFIEGLSLQAVAEPFGSTYHTVRSWVRDFRAQCQAGHVPPLLPNRRWADPVATPLRNRLLNPKHQPRPMSANAVSSQDEGGAPGSLACSCFSPCWPRLRFDLLVAQAGYPSSQMVPATAAWLSLLALKLLDKERRSPIGDVNFEEAFGLLAGRNVLPKKSFVTDYSYRTSRHQQQQLLSGWIRGLAPWLFPEAQTSCLDFHPIPYRGDPDILDNHFLPLRGKAGPSILTFLAHEPISRVLCYANANLTRADQGGELMRFIEFWHAITGHDPPWLYFDSKLVPYAELAQVNQRQIWFVTIRRRGAAILRRLQSLPATAWQRTVLDIPKRRHKNILYMDETVRLRDYPGSLRQLAITGLGRAQPTLGLSNNFEVSARDVISRYARRNSVEDALGISVNFFHLDCLASEVRLNVDLDVALTVLAHGCYRWLATRLRGFEKAKPKQLYRRFVETGGVVEVQPERLVVHFDKRCPNPILREAALDQDCPGVPWLYNLPVSFEYP